MFQKFKGTIFRFLFPENMKLWLASSDIGIKFRIGV